MTRRFYFFNTTIHEPLLQWIFFVLSYSFFSFLLSLGALLFLLYFVILLFVCLFFIFLDHFYCLNIWTFNSRAFYSGWYSSADYNTKFLSCFKISGGAFAKSIGILLGVTGRSYTHRSVTDIKIISKYCRNNCFRLLRPGDINILFQKPKWRLLLK